MATLTSDHSTEPWRRRLYLPNYQIGEAARYAQISAQTVAAWHRADDGARPTLSEKTLRASLSYMQLIEVAVVATFRKADITMKTIRSAREYVSKTLKSEYPFCEYRFKTDGKELLIDFVEVDGARGAGKMLTASRGGQLALTEIIKRRLKEFDYDDGMVSRWHVAGKNSPIVIDPRISFGAPTIKGVPTWVLHGRRNAGESLDDIADDFAVSIADVRKALKFEELEAKPKKWVH